MKEMVLTGTDKVALVDDDDFLRFNGFNWYLSHIGYVITDSSKPRRALGVPRRLRLHRLVLAAPDSWAVDHINGNPLDNRKENLRLCTLSQNAINSDRVPRISKLKGAYFRYGMRNGKRYELKKPWFSFIRESGRNRQLGSFYTAEEAHEAYKKASIELHGEFSVFKSRGIG